LNALSLAYVAIRLLALWFIVEGLVYLATVLPSAAFSGLDALTLFGLLVLFVIGGLLWLLTPTISNLMLPRDGRTYEVPVDSDSVVRTVVVVFGLYLIVSAIPNVIYLAAWIAQEQGQEQSSLFSNYSTSEQFLSSLAAAPWGAQFAREVTRLTVGLALIIGSGGIARLIASLRDFGLRDKRTPE